MMSESNRAELRYMAVLASVLLCALFASLGYAAQPGIAGPAVGPSVLPMPLEPVVDAPAVVPESSEQPAGGQECQIRIGSNQFDYGRFSKRALANRDGNAGELLVGQQTSLVKVSCRTPQRVALSFRGASTADGQSYAFGAHGKVHLALLDAQADGQRIQLGVGDAGMPASAWGEQAALLPNRAVTLHGNRQVSQLSLRLEVLATVPTNAKSPATVQRWIDSGQLQLHIY